MTVEVTDDEIVDEMDLASERSVLLVVDMQNDFAHPDGARYDGFYQTGLDHALGVEERDQLVACGTVANLCDHYPAASASLRFLDVVHRVEPSSAMRKFDMHAALRQASWLFQARLVHAYGLTFSG